MSEDQVPDRIWDRFLTEQDRLVLAMAPKQARDPRDFCRVPALILIDLYRGAFGDRPLPINEAIAEWPSSCGLAAWNALPPIVGLLGRCREIGLPIVHTTGIVEGAVQGQHYQPVPSDASPVESLGRFIPAEVRYEIIPEVAPLAGETVIRKVSSSALWGTPLIGQLVGNGVDTLIVCGESTSGCVRATVVDADEYQFNVIVVEDCVFDRHEATHALNLFDMHRKFAEVLPSEEVIAFLDEFDKARNT